MKPALRTELFLPNNYCNTCYKLGCAAAYEANKSISDQQFQGITYVAWTNAAGVTVMRENDTAGMGHNPNNCGSEENQVISKSSNGTITVKEIKIQAGSDNLTTLPCTLISGSFNVGSVVKWTTYREEKLYHHWGYVTATNAKKPNMS